MEKITRSQLELLKLGKGVKGFTVDEAVTKLKSLRQSIYQRIDAAIERSWLTWVKEESDGSRERYRMYLTPTGRKLIETKWGGKGRYLVPIRQTKTNGKH